MSRINNTDTITHSVSTRDFPDFRLMASLLLLFASPLLTFTPPLQPSPAPLTPLTLPLHALALALERPALYGLSGLLHLVPFALDPLSAPLASYALPLPALAPSLLLLPPALQAFAPLVLLLRPHDRCADQKRCCCNYGNDDLIHIIPLYDSILYRAGG